MYWLLTLTESVENREQAALVVHVHTLMAHDNTLGLTQLLTKVKLDRSVVAGCLRKSVVVTLHCSASHCIALRFVEIE